MQTTRRKTMLPTGSFGVGATGFEPVTPAL
jgi:hypothetical protein